jgi:hypothetical protein
MTLVGDLFLGEKNSLFHYKKLGIFWNFFGLNLTTFSFFFGDNS